MSNVLISQFKPDIFSISFFIASLFLILLHLIKSEPFFVSFKVSTEIFRSRNLTSFLIYFNKVPFVVCSFGLTRIGGTLFTEETISAYDLATRENTFVFVFSKFEILYSNIEILFSFSASKLFIRSFTFLTIKLSWSAAARQHVTRVESIMVTFFCRSRHE